MRKEKRNKIRILIFFIIDRLSKYFFRRFSRVTINRGISFGFFSDYGGLIVLIAILGIYFFLPRKNSFFWWLILVGGFSNLIDRFLFGGVIDFITIPYLPSFNLADMGIILGTFCLLVDLGRSKSL